MANMRLLMPALQKARQVPKETDGASFARVSLPAARRATRVVKDMTPEQIAQELASWIGGGRPSDGAACFRPLRRLPGRKRCLFLTPTQSDGTLAAPPWRRSRSPKRGTGPGRPPGPLASNGEKVEAAANQIAGCGPLPSWGLPALNWRSRATGRTPPRRSSGTQGGSQPDPGPRHQPDAPGDGRRGPPAGRARGHACHRISDSLEITRWYYRQRMEATLSRTQRPWVLLVEPGCHEPWIVEGGTAQVQPVSLELTEADRRTTVEGLQAPTSSQATVRPEADLLFVAGAGWTKAQKDGRARSGDAEKLILDSSSSATPPWEGASRWWTWARRARHRSRL